MTHEQKPESAEFRTREAQVARMCQLFHFPDAGALNVTAASVITRNILEAEARGAAGQRRKDAEGAEQPTCYVNADRLRWHLSHGGSYMTTISAEPVKASVLHHNLQDGLYLRPANVAALEKALNDIGNEVLEGAEPFLDAVIRILKTVGIDPLDGTEPVDQIANLEDQVAALEDRVKELKGENERLKKPEFYAVRDLEDSWLSTEELMDSLDGDIPHFETVEIDCFRRVSRIWAFYDGKTVCEFAAKEEAEVAAAAAIREGGEHG